VLLLAHVQGMLEAHIGPVRLTRLPQAKFLFPLRPGEPCVVAFADLADGRAKIECRSGPRAIARVSLQFEADASRAG
jgi:hypothetical protein